MELSGSACDGIYVFCEVGFSCSPNFPSFFSSCSLVFETMAYPNSILPALAFSLDMFTKTNMSYGVNEVLLASVLGAVVFAVFAAQPLVIVGVTGRYKGSEAL